jgi:hypothetical protein
MEELDTQFSSVFWEKKIDVVTCNFKTIYLSISFFFSLRDVKTFVYFVKCRIVFINIWVEISKFIHWLEQQIWGDIKLQVQSDLASNLIQLLISIQLFEITNWQTEAASLKLLQYWNIHLTPFDDCVLGSSEFGILKYFKLIWIAESILGSNYQIRFSLFLAIFLWK